MNFEFSNHELYSEDGPACLETMSLLEKRIANESLTEEEQHRIDSHLKECVSCREFMSLTSNLPFFAETLSEKEMLSAINIASDRYFIYLRNRKRIAVAASVIAAAAACAAFLFFPFSSEKEASTKNSNVPAIAEMECDKAEPFSPIPGVRMILCGPSAEDVVIDADGNTVLSLTQGGVGCVVDPLRPNKRDIFVVTPFGDVQVKGTIFTVQVDSDDATVEVRRGQVDIRPASRPDAVFNVEAGHGATIRTKRVFALSNSHSDVLTKRLMESSGIERNDDRNSEEKPLFASAEGKAEDSMDGGVARGASLDRGWASPQKTIPTPSADDLIKSAHACLLEHDWECAAARYRQILKDFGNRSESVSALIGLARIELHYLSKPKQALSHFSAYDKRYPNGPLAEEALLGIAESLRLLGQKDKERASLQTFLARYPRSASAQKAKSRLKELGE